MPHVFVEYSANVEEEMGLDRLFDRLVDVAVDTGVFALKGIRVRGVRRDRYRIADGRPENGFVHVVLRVGHGRPEEALKAAGDRIYDAVCGHLEELFDRRPLNVSMEIQEIHPRLTFKKNNIAERTAARLAAE